MTIIFLTGSYIRLLSGKAQGGNYTVASFLSREADRRIDNTDSATFDYLSQTVKAMIGEGGFKDRDVTMLVSSGAEAVQEFIVPYEKKPAAMLNIVKSRLSSNMDYDENVMDYSIADVFTNEKGAQVCRVYVYIVKKEIVSFCRKLAEAAGKRPKCFTVPHNCAFNLLSPQFSAEDDATLAVNIERYKISAHLFSGKDAYTARYAAFNADDAADTKAGITDKAADEISKMIQFQTIKQPDNPIKNIYIFGDYASEEAAKQITAFLGHDVSLIKQPILVSAPEGFDFPAFLYAVGALTESR